MTTYPRVPAIGGMEHARFSPTRQTLLAPSTKRREVYGEVDERGVACVLLIIDRGADFLANGLQRHIIRL